MIKPNFSAPIIQIAGIKNIQEALLVHQCGCHFIGFPLRLPINQEDQTEEEAKQLISLLPQALSPVLICYENKAKNIIDFARFLNVSIIQLHGAISIHELQKLKQQAPKLIIIKSLIITGKNTIELLQQIHQQSPFVDLFITDTHDPQTGADGATGLTHDWNISKQLVQLCPKPIILAGGLNPDNVFSAITQVKPFGVDVHTGIEDLNGNKSLIKTQLFISEATRGFKNIFFK